MTPKTRKRGLRPHVSINMAMTGDGKIATANRKVSSFGSDKDKDRLLVLRAQSDAVMAGARTVDSNLVTMGPGPAKYRKQRLRRGLAEYNIRIIVSRSASVNPNAHIFKRRFSPILLLTTGRAPENRLRRLRGLVDEIRVCGPKEIDWPETLGWLRRKWNVKRLLCEGGGELNDALFRAGVVDELNLTICPLVFGGRAAPTISDGLGVPTLPEAAMLKLHSMRRVGDELFLILSMRLTLGHRRVRRSARCSTPPSPSRASSPRSLGPGQFAPPRAGWHPG